LIEIGVHFGVGESGVCRSGRRVERRMKRERRLNKKIEVLKKGINEGRMRI